MKISIPHVKMYGLQRQGQNFAREAAKGIKTRRDLSEFNRALTEVVKKRKPFPTDNFVRKVIFLVV